MSTRALYGYKDGDYYYVNYVHHDGYPEHVGELLKNVYNNIDSLKELMSYGDASSLENNIKDCEFYIRDYKEDVEHNKTISYTKESFIYYLEKSLIDYIYIFNIETNKWKIVDRDNRKGETIWDTM